MLAGLLFLMVHLLLCVFFVFAIAHGILRVRMETMPLVLFVPVWGMICALLIHFRLMQADKVRAVTGVEKLRVHEDIYRSFLIPENAENNVTSLEDVLLLNEAKTRRSQMMALLNDDPGEYLSLLRQARMNSDVEVVHYATTAMSELNKEYDLKLQKAERNYGDNPEDPQRLDAYIEVLGDYLQKALAPERIQRIQRQQYVTLLQKRFQQQPTLSDGVELVRHLLQLETFSEAEQLLDELARSWPEDQQVWLLRLEIAARLHNGAQVQRILHEAKERRIYFDARGRETLAFWKKGEAG